MLDGEFISTYALKKKSNVVFRVRLDTQRIEVGDVEHEMQAYLYTAFFIS